MKRLSAKAKDVHTEFVQVLGSDAIAYSTVTKYIQNDSILENEPDAEDQGFLITDSAVLEALGMMPLVSIHQIAKITFIPSTTVFRRLMKSLHFVLKRLHFVPHRLSDLQKQARAIISKELLKLLESMRHHSWKSTVMLDEAWCYLFIILLIMNQFGSVQKMKLHKGRVIFEDDAHGCLEPTRISFD
jgi:hypothetical protein